MSERRGEEKSDEEYRREEGDNKIREREIR